MSQFEIFLQAPPGLEPFLHAEAVEVGFDKIETVPGGVTCRGDWRDVWRANLHLRIAGRVLVRFAEFRAMHLAQLDKRARKVDWGQVIAPGASVNVEVTCRKSKIYHAGAATQRVEQALSAFGAEVGKADDALKLMVRIDDDLATFSVDTSGAPLHKRGHKQAVVKAPMRETYAAAFLRACGYKGGEPVLDPMCGSGTFVIEAAEIAAGLLPGRGRAFAFEGLPSFDPDVWAALQDNAAKPRSADLRFAGSDRDDGAIRASVANAERAGLAEVCDFARRPLSDLTRPDGPPGVVMVNPPYGARIGNRKLLFGLYGQLGKILSDQFSGWRVGLVTCDGGLAKATGLPFLKDPVQVPHGGLKIRLYQTARLSR